MTGYYGLPRRNTDVYDLLLDMSTNMNKLFSNLGLEEPPFSIQTPHPFFYYIERIAKSGATEINMKALNSQLKKAISRTENLQFEHWTQGENLKELQGEISSLKEQMTLYQSQIQEMEKQKRQVEEERKKLRSDLAQLIEQQNELRLVKKQHLDNIMSLISFRDSILMMEGLAESQGEAKLQSAMDSMLKGTANLLEKSQVIILDQMGPFDSSIQTVVDIQETADETLHNTVVSVFRPGYRFNDEMIRPEEVVLYKYKA